MKRNKTIVSLKLPLSIHVAIAQAAPKTLWSTSHKSKRGGRWRCDPLFSVERRYNRNYGIYQLTLIIGRVKIHCMR